MGRDLLIVEAIIGVKIEHFPFGAYSSQLSTFFQGEKFWWTSFCPQLTTNWTMHLNIYRGSSSELIWLLMKTICLNKRARKQRKGIIDSWNWKTLETMDLGITELVGQWIPRMHYLPSSSFALPCLPSLSTPFEYPRKVPKENSRCTCTLFSYPLKEVNIFFSFFCTTSRKDSCQSGLAKYLILCLSP